MISETAAGLAQLQHVPQGELESRSQFLALVTRAWLLSHSHCKWRSWTIKSRIWLHSCWHCCCKMWLNGKWLYGLWYLSGWVHTAAFWGAYLWIEGFFSDPVTALGLARLNLVLWECLRFEAELWSISTWNIQVLWTRKTWGALGVDTLCTNCIFSQTSPA